MATKSIGFVVELRGAAQVRGVDGINRVLSIGDPVYDGDVLSTAPGAEIVLEFFNGSRLQLEESTEILLDETVITGESVHRNVRQLTTPGTSSLRDEEWRMA